VDGRDTPGQDGKRLGAQPQGADISVVSASAYPHGTARDQTCGAIGAGRRRNSVVFLTVFDQFPFVLTR
jgi:hypothetical protein